MFRKLTAASLPLCALGLGSRTSALSTASAPAKTVRVAVVQMESSSDKAANLVHCRALLAKAAATGAKLVVLPEIWNSPYAVGEFRCNAEAVKLSADGPSGPSVGMLQAAAAEHGVWIVGGSVPELGACGNVYNTSPVIDSQGQVVAKHRKVHLFDIDVPGKIRFFESETLAAGASRTVAPLPADLGGGALGVAICYDMRFAELAVSMRKHGATILVYPGAFNTVTGPPHYRLLAMARALDAQAFVVAASPARSPTATYQAYGYSVVVDPWGQPVAAAEGHGEEIIVADLDLARLDEVRASMKLLDQRRPDVY
ncbi:carbon-nitrogen hydrolase [Pelagophyceae sp. CCMP2097]|nr:carbon-nitrogen hydrolase [Pelagophyceae sp. CCMP2097]